MKVSNYGKYLFFVFLTLIIGMSMNVQSAFNGQLRLITDNPVFASTANFAVGSLSLLLLLFVASRFGSYRMPDKTQLCRSSWWMWTGGPLGAVYVIASVLIPVMIGYGAFFSMLVAGQLLFSAAVDHYGWLGNRVVKINRRKVAGIILLLIGAFLVQNT